MFKKKLKLCDWKEGEDGDTSLGDFNSFIASHMDGGSEESAEAGGEIESVEAEDNNPIEVEETQNNGEEHQDQTPNELDSLKAQNAQLMQLVQNMQGLIKQPEASPDPTPAPIDPFEGETFDQLSSTMGWDSDEQTAMKAFLKLVTKKTHDDAVSASQAQIPDIVNSAMTTQQKQQAVQKSFYSDNPKLAVVKPYVASIAEAVFAEQKALGQTLDVENILKITADRAYKALNISKDPVAPKESAEPGRGKQNPAFATQTGSRKVPNKLSSDEKMIQAMIDLDR